MREQRPKQRRAIKEITNTQLNPIVALSSTAATRRRLGASVAFALSLGFGLAACSENGCGCDPPVVEGSGIIVTDANVRSCDVVFKAPGDEVPKVVFTNLVRGEFVPRAPHVGVSFAARTDAAMDNQELGRVEYTSGTGTVELVSAECFDAAGAVIAGDVVRLAE